MIGSLSHNFIGHKHVSIFNKVLSLRLLPGSILEHFVCSAVPLKMHKFPNSSILKISIPSKSTEVKIFSDHYPNIYHRLSYNFPHYYKFYFNITYCLLITPFRISFKDNGPKIITNPIQTVIKDFFNLY